MTEGRRYVSETTLQEMLDALSKDLKSHFTKQFAIELKPINDEIAALKLELKSKVDVIDNLKADMELIKSANEELVSVNKSLEAKLVSSEEFQVSAIESFRQLEEKLEDRTNRQLRQTIVVKGIPEKENEKWTDTRNLLAKHVSKYYKMDYKDAYALFERVHRGGGYGHQERKKGRRDIFALCSKWDDSEYLVWNSFEVNKTRPKKERVVIEYKYGPLTSIRRGHAMKMRKEILEQKTYKNAYVKFPAILFARKDGEDKYNIVKDFSNETVSKLPIMAGKLV